MIKRVQVIDSHTGGEPTRVIVQGGPNLGLGTIQERLAVFRNQFDSFRSAMVNEPRGSDVLVGAMLLPSSNPAAARAVIFFNNIGYLGMCGHGTIGLVKTLEYLKKISPGDHLFETPVGIITATLHEDGTVSVRNVPSFRKVKDAVFNLPGLGQISGDIAWGGNWFFLSKDQRWSLDLQNVEKLTEIAWEIRRAVNTQGFPEVDHVELFGPPQNPGAHSRNFVLCPGKAYDRSPCGTGTSAKLACMFADGELQPGEIWCQESITGSLFSATFQILDGQVIPQIKGSAFITAESTLIMDDKDPCCWGFGGLSLLA